MNRRPLAAAAVLAVALLPGLALASPAPAVSESAVTFASGAARIPGEFAANTLALASSFVPAGGRYDAVGYRPRTARRGYDRGPWMASPVQFHIGGFDPEGEDAGEMFVAGFRAGPQIDRHVQVGLGLDWMHKSEDQSIVLSESEGPGGSTITTRQQLSESTSDLFPIMAFIQVNADEDLPVIPYAGLAGGYQVLFLSATDYASREEFDATYGGWAWQAWAGLALPLSGQMRLTGELFLNNGEASRDTDGPLGITYHETVGLDGGGGRIGLTWGF